MSEIAPASRRAPGSASGAKTVFPRPLRGSVLVRVSSGGFQPLERRRDQCQSYQ